MTRRILLVTHAGRPDVPQLVEELTDHLAANGIDVDVVPEPQHGGPPRPGGTLDASGDGPNGGGDISDDVITPELVVVFGGDGTILRGAEIARASGAPVLGVNLGRVGFLAEAEREEVSLVAEQIVARDYEVQERMTLEVDVHVEGSLLYQGWALNEASVEKAARERMLEVTVEIDGRPLSRWSGDGVVVSTPTGSTAYAFSAGGPVVWPDVETLLVVPISAHALFARPLVLGPETRLAVDVLPTYGGRAVLWCDGRRTIDVPGAARIDVRRGAVPVRLARLHTGSFTDRLVAKFDLPVDGWRGRTPGSEV